MNEQIKIPLLADRHSHPLFYAAFGQAVSLESVSTKTAANEALQEAWRHDSAELKIVHGWRSNFFEWTVEELERFPPLAIFNVSLHSLLINRAGKQVLLERYGDVVEQLDNRQWYENNLRVVLNWFANLYGSAVALEKFYADLLSLGVYYAEEMLLVDGHEIELFQQAGLRDRTKFWAAPDTFEALNGPVRNEVHGLKLFTDGAIGSHTAAISRPYIGGSDEANTGMLIYSDRELLETIERCFDLLPNLAIHAIGDRAIEQVIGVLEGIDSPTGGVRIEHAQLIDEELAGRAKAIGLTLCMQPNFSQDSIDYADRMDGAFCRANNPFRMLIDQVGFVPGKDLIFGSDGMPHGVKTAITQSLFPSIPGQCLTMEEFVAGYCLDSDLQGTIEVSIDRELGAVDVAL